MITVELDDGTVVQVRGESYTQFDLLCEVINANRDSREPKHPLLDIARRMSAHRTGEGDLLQLVQALDASYREVVQ